MGRWQIRDWITSLLNCGPNLSVSNDQRRACLLKRYRFLSAKNMLLDIEAMELDDVKVQLANTDYRKIRGDKLQSKAKRINTNEQSSKFFFKHKQNEYCAVRLEAFCLVALLSSF